MRYQGGIWLDTAKFKGIDMNKITINLDDAYDNDWNELTNIIPFSPEVATDIGVMAAGVFSVIWAECQTDTNAHIKGHRHIADRLQIGRQSVVRHIRTLIDKGYIVCPNDGENGATKIYTLPGDEVHPSLMTKDIYPSLHKKSKHSNKRRDGYVYLIEAYFPGSGYKIGRAKSVKDRMSFFGVKLPFEWSLIHSFKADDYYRAERRLQGQYQDKVIHGEWFDLSLDDVARIQAITKYENGKYQIGTQRK